MTDACVVCKRAELEAEIERLAAENADFDKWITWQRKELGLLRADNERLWAAIQRIDGINDTPADFNSEINAVCDTILRPALKETKP